MTKKEYFSKKEAIETILESLESYEGHASDLHHEVFNTDYYIIGTYKAKQALEQYGTFDAIEEIQEYEKNNFGEVTTDLSDAEKVANMLWYIIGENVLNELDIYDVDYIDDENRDMYIQSVKNISVR